MVTNPVTSVLDLFQETGAYLKGHFRLTSGLHSPEYLQCALVLQHPRHAETLGKALGEGLAALTGSQKIHTVVSPAMGGLIIGHEVAGGPGGGRPREQPRRGGGGSSGPRGWGGGGGV